MKYDIIYADPPWQYSSGGARGGKFDKLDYPTMSIKELKQLPVANISADDCALFMWVTSPFLAESVEIAKAWGFKYIRVDKVWSKKTTSGKPHAVCGPWGMTDVEFILLFTKGKICSKQRGVRNNLTLGEVVEAVYPGKHSRKPDIFRNDILRRFPLTLNRLEMFAREKPLGWDVFGNEVSDSVEIK